ncbi:MAG: hypothetical protein OPY08_03285, partial [Nitrosopumilus sp.]|nr:hypothetical protein [Nitrosopumilus sp.]
ILRELGWSERSSSHAHYIFIRPVKYPKIRRKIAKPLLPFVDYSSKQFFGLLLRIRAYGYPNLKIEALTSDTLQKFVDPQKNSNSEVTTLRNWEYLSWRFLDSPEFHKYRIVSWKDKDQLFLIKLEPDEGIQIKHIEILMSLNPKHSEFVRQMGSLGIFAKAHDFNYLIMYTNDERLHQKLRQKLLSYPIYQIYAFHSHNNQMMDWLRNSNHSWEFMDSDFERFDPY